MDRTDQARIAKAQQDIRALESALNLYRLDNYIYPTTEQSLQALVEHPRISPEPPKWKAGGYVDHLPNHSWGNLYGYLSPGQYREIDIYSLGADGQLGSEGINADIGNWGLDQGQ
jgi:general secretion pathway protein G